jgi:hypothetical protein
MADYTTSFTGGTESPLSESGVWLSGSGIWGTHDVVSGERVLDSATDTEALSWINPASVSFSPNQSIAILSEYTTGTQYKHTAVAGRVSKNGSNEITAYIATASAGSNLITIDKYIADAPDGSFGSGEKTPTTTVADAVELRMEVTDEGSDVRVKVYYDDVLEFNVLDTSSPIASGQPGINSYRDVSTKYP